ncbi:Rne/Rng family ribonuclease [Roseibium litorale]|uniref:Ribonuclease E n=1 Tax=Roseibium litorale TaxID=2803841 RepID=A0ABR9CTL7_9HYPH|nr:ribonuclease E/G [Roseibium litorale]MBD8894225.1 ribonuclease E/G [Roseibium litorale]
MANKMLIDAGHPEETRVVVVRGNRVEEFDFEAANRKQLRGNIYLAKVTRVEPSLQAAFVEYGGNRHGFLAFSEIHPDYYQIPVADRQALLEEEDSGFDSDDTEEKAKPRGRGRSRSRAKAANNESADETVSEAADDSEGSGNDADSSADDNGDHDHDGEDAVDTVGAEDAMEEVPVRRQSRRQYKIQEVIKRRQVILVQVVKEERGNKGAALTTYLSLAGRYSVLMPNTGRGGGISRKITQPTDRKRLKKIASELEVPEGMGVILRTAGASRTKAEIKRDFEYLMRLWENVRDLTLKSTAPSLVYEEGSLIKRSIRDLYNKDIDEVLVAGEEGYREAKDFMRMLMPSHAKNVQPYRDASPLFIRYGVEPQLDAMFSPQVTLKSGGYIVINQTEALVSIDVNSGKSTREHNIEDTALQTNLEAAEEVTRQLRLRDLAGLVVIDFIDMEENKNNRAVERKLKDCLKNDRARIQVGRISHFGLLEMSRQRIRTGVLESSTSPCPHCHGTGMIRSVESVALHVLRSLEDNLLKSASHNLIVRTTAAVALYILNQKRSHLSDLEARFAVEIEVQAEHMHNGQHYVLERADPVDRERFPQPVQPAVQPHTIEPMDELDLEVEEPEDEVEDEETETEVSRNQDEGSDRDRRRRRRRKRRRGGNSEGGQDGEAREASSEGGDDAQGDDADTEDGEQSAEAGEGGSDEPRRKRRRGRRGGRRGRRNGEDGELSESPEDGNDAEASAEGGDDGEAIAVSEGAESGSEAPVADAPASEAAPEMPADASVEAEAAPVAEAQPEAPAAPASEPVETVEEPAAAEAQAEEAPEPAKISTPAPSAAPVEPVVTSETAASEPDQPEKPKRGGWWQRRSFF